MLNFKIGNREVGKKNPNGVLYLTPKKTLFTKKNLHLIKNIEFH